MNNIASATNGKSRIIALLVFILFILLAIWALLIFSREISILSDVSQVDSEVAIIRMKLLVKTVCYAMVISGIGIGAYFFRLAIRTKSTGQYPPPGTFLIRDTKIYHDSAAQLRATLLMILAITTILSGFVFSFFINSILNRLTNF